MSDKLRQILFIPLLFQIVMLALMISLCSFEAVSSENYLSTKFSARGNLVICVINEVFMFSFYGEKLLHESRMISDKIYTSKWYLFYSSSSNRSVVKEFSSLMQITMMRANKPIKLSAGGFTTMSFQTFMSVSCRQLKRV
jgi:hypothetical protein